MAILDDLVEADRLDDLGRWEEAAWRRLRTLKDPLVRRAVEEAAAMADAAVLRSS